MAWLKIYQSIRQHRKILDAADALEIAPPYMIGLLTSFWLWALDNAPDGRIQTGSYTDREGRKVYTTEVVVEEAEFAESKNKNSNQQEPPTGPASGDGFMNIPEDADDQLPFN